MCNPPALMIVATMATAAYTADVQRQAGKANAQIAENNAALARADADATNAAATRESEQQTWRTRQIIGQQRAAIAAANVDPTLGTPADILGETAMLGEVDQQTIRMNAARTAWGLDMQARNFQNQGSLARWQGNAQARGTILGGLMQSGNIAYGAWGSGGSSGLGYNAGTRSTTNKAAGSKMRWGA